MKNCIFLEKEIFYLNNGISSYFFKIKNGDNKEYSVNIKMMDEEIIGCHCTCIFGSFYKFTKKNLKNNMECYHVIDAIKQIKNVSNVSNIIKNEKNT